MSSLDNLPPDQRAVLQMVLQRGRSYDEIANLLSIDRAAVRQRALDGFDALAPAAVIPGPERALVTDYLLQQLPDKVSEQVYAYLQASEADREWALAVAAKVAPLAPRALPEIPVGAPLGADDGPDGGLEQDSDPPAADAGVVRESDKHLEAAGEAVVTDAVVGASVAQPRQGPPSSRRGGMILLAAVAAVIVIAVLVGVISSSGSSSHKSTAAKTQTTQTVRSSTSASTTTTNGTPPPVAQLNLVSPTGAKDTVGVVQVIRAGHVVGVAIEADGVPPNTTHNAYAVWLYNSPSSHKFVGFVPKLVGKNGRLATEGQLPAGAARFHKILITLETQSKPTSPGEVVLSGPFREHS
jgi:Sigma-70, region 4